VLVVVVVVVVVPSPLVAVSVVVEVAALPSGDAVDVDVLPSGLVPPQAVSAAASTTLAAARAIVWNLSIKRVRLLFLLGYACSRMDEYPVWLDHLHLTS
jgi:hypothetical protein